MSKYSERAKNQIQFWPKLEDGVLTEASMRRAFHLSMRSCREDFPFLVPNAWKDVFDVMVADVTRYGSRQRRQQKYRR